ncbi:NADH oxidase [Yinghuangia seranimata]|nr:NADH oxidase [Yinghuangia seranimata]
MIRASDPDPAVFRLWSLAESVRIGRARDGALLLAGPWGVDRVERPSAPVRELLRRMALGPVRLENVGLDAAETSAVLPVLDRLSHLVVHTLGVDDLGGPLLSALPRAPHAPFVPSGLPPAQVVRLRGRSALTVRGRGFVLDHDGAGCRVELHRAEAVVIASALGWPVGSGEVSDLVRMPAAVVAPVLEYLAAAGALVSDNGTPLGTTGFEESVANP